MSAVRYMFPFRCGSQTLNDVPKRLRPSGPQPRNITTLILGFVGRKRRRVALQLRITKNVRFRHRHLSPPKQQNLARPLDKRLKRCLSLCSVIVLLLLVSSSSAVGSPPTWRRERLCKADTIWCRPSDERSNRRRCRTRRVSSTGDEAASAGRFPPKHVLSSPRTNPAPAP